VTTALYYLAYSAVLTWVMVFGAGLLRARAWTPAGMKVAFGNRHDVPEPSPVAARAERAGKNMLENLPLFIALVAAVHLGGRHGERVDLGAAIFFWARVAYWPIYLLGIPYVRTLVWYGSLAGLALIFSAIV
jgi:uncharacterized MAPEG superfamily protein